MPASVVQDVGTPRAPRGFEIDTSELQHANDVIGKLIMFMVIGSPLDEDDYDWYVAKIQKQLTEAEKKNNSNCTHWATFDVQVSDRNQVLLTAYKQKSRKFSLAISTSADSRRGIRWVLLKKL